MHNITRYVSDLLGRTRLSIDTSHSLLCPYFILGQMDIKQGHRHWLKSCYTTWQCLMCRFTTIFITLSYNIFIDCSSKDCCMYFPRSHFPCDICGIYILYEHFLCYELFIWTVFPQNLTTIMHILICFLLKQCPVSRPWWTWMEAFSTSCPHHGRWHLHPTFSQKLNY